jgi:hypothetical protein
MIKRVWRDGSMCCWRSRLLDNAARISSPSLLKKTIGRPLCLEAEFDRCGKLPEALEFVAR